MRDIVSMGDFVNESFPPPHVVDRMRRRGISFKPSYHPLIFTAFEGADSVQEELDRRGLRYTRTPSNWQGGDGFSVEVGDYSPEASELLKALESVSRIDVCYRMH